MKLNRKQLRRMINEAIGKEYTSSGTFSSAGSEARHAARRREESDWAMSGQDRRNSGQLEAGLKSALTELLTQNMAMGADEKMIERALESALVQVHAAVRGTEMIYDVEITKEDPRSNQNRR